MYNEPYQTSQKSQVYKMLKVSSQRVKGTQGK